mgnify:CR=1 FL=1
MWVSSFVFSILQNCEMEETKVLNANNRNVEPIPDINTDMNDLKIKRYRASEFLLIYEARINYYMTANKDLIEEEIQNAKREEIRGSLGDLVAYMEEA